MFPGGNIISMLAVSQDPGLRAFDGNLRTYSKVHQCMPKKECTQARMEPLSVNGKQRGGSDETLQSQ